MTATDPKAPSADRPQGESVTPAASADSGARGPATKAERTFQAFSMSSVGLEMGVSVLLGIGVGYYLDKEFDSSPYLTLVFMGLGVTAGFRALFRVARQAKRMYGESNDQKPTP